jgi:hypothetical protein
MISHRNDILISKAFVRNGNKVANSFRFEMFDLHKEFKNIKD